MSHQRPALLQARQTERNYCLLDWALSGIEKQTRGHGGGLICFLRGFLGSRTRRRPRPLCSRG